MGNILYRSPCCCWPASINDGPVSALLKGVETCRAETAFFFLFFLAVVAYRPTVSAYIGLKGGKKIHPDAGNRRGSFSDR